MSLASLGDEITEERSELSVCPGCLLALPQQPGPTHAYVASSPECWALFTETVARAPQRLISDAYMAQHPDGDDPRQVQSVAVHLVTLEAILKRDMPLGKASAVTAAAVELGKAMGGYHKLHRPTSWTSTVADVSQGTVSPDTYAQDILQAWESTDGRQIARWTEDTLDYLYGR